MLLRIAIFPCVSTVFTFIAGSLVIIATLKSYNFSIGITLELVFLCGCLFLLSYWSYLFFFFSWKFCIVSWKYYFCKIFSLVNILCRTLILFVVCFSSQPRESLSVWCEVWFQCQRLFKAFSVLFSLRPVGATYRPVWDLDSGLQACVLNELHYPARLHCPWGSLDKNTGMGCHALLQGTFPT